MANQDRTRARQSSTTVGGSSTGRDTASDTGPSATLSRAGTNRETPVRHDAGMRWSNSPLGQWRGWTDQMERLFNNWTLGSPGNLRTAGDWSLWTPQIETFQRGDELVIRADLPGLNKENVTVEVTDDAVIIQGERRDEFEDKGEGFFRSERTYGSFYRAVPLPEGAITDHVTASFKDGVLEITMPAPPREVSRGRRIEIGEPTK